MLKVEFESPRTMIIKPRQIRHECLIKHLSKLINRMYNSCFYLLLDDINKKQKTCNDHNVHKHMHL